MLVVGWVLMFEMVRVSSLMSSCWDRSFCYISWMTVCSFSLYFSLSGVVFSTVEGDCWCRDCNYYLSRLSCSSCSLFIVDI